MEEKEFNGEDFGLVVTSDGRCKMDSGGVLDPCQPSSKRDRIPDDNITSTAADVEILSRKDQVVSLSGADSNSLHNDSLFVAFATFKTLLASMSFHRDVRPRRSYEISQRLSVKG
ncbi:hypothetical protein CBL_10711 [Carabus blaptoides fortunei]